MVVAHADASNGGEDIQELVSINVCDVVTVRSFEINGELLLLVARDITVLRDRSLAERTGELSFDDWGGRLVWEALGRY